MSSDKSPLLADEHAAAAADGVPDAYAAAPQSAFAKWNGDTSVFGTQGRVYRFSALLLICMLTFGSYFSYDIPGSISTSLEVRPNATHKKNVFFFFRRLTMRRV